jgi:selenocysteine-specific elongation factor
VHVIGTAGHVDHGKSTLVRALTGIDPDRFEEEKRRGLTIDLGFAWCTLASGREVGIIDVPGHERFIRNMLAGVGAIEAALFVVAADEGWMPQSAEHLQILDFLGVDRGVVALTKIDSAGDLADMAEEDVREHLSGTSLEGAPIVRVSAVTGDGLDDLLRALDDALGTIHAPAGGTRTRLWIDRSFTIKGAGTVVTGTLHGGPLRVGDEVRIVPDGRRARIRSMQTHETDVEDASGPRRLALNLVGLDRHLVHRGDALLTDEWILSKRFAARIRPARGIDHQLKERGAYELFVGSAEVRCRLRFLEESASPLAEIFCSRELPIVPGDRFVIRDVGRWETVAGGVVIDQVVKRPDVDVLREREDVTGEALAEWLVVKEGVIPLADLQMRAGVRCSPAAQAGGFAFAPGFVAALEQRVLSGLAAFHTANPLKPGISIAELAEDLGVGAEPLKVVLGGLKGRGSIVLDGNAARLPDHRGASLSAQERRTADGALSRLREAGASPPEFSETGLSTDLARALERTGELVFLTPAIAYPSDVWADIERRVVRFVTDNGSATVAQIRDAVGTTRKYAVPLLEKLDATGVTRRRGDVRELGSRGRELADR